MKDLVLANRRLKEIGLVETKDIDVAEVKQLRNIVSKYQGNEISVGYESSRSIHHNIQVATEASNYLIAAAIAAVIALIARVFGKGKSSGGGGGGGGSSEKKIKKADEVLNDMINKKVTESLFSKPTTPNQENVHNKMLEDLGKTYKDFEGPNKFNGSYRINQNPSLDDIDNNNPKNEILDVFANKTMRRLGANFPTIFNKSFVREVSIAAIDAELTNSFIFEYKPFTKIIKIVENLLEKGLDRVNAESVDEYPNLVIERWLVGHDAKHEIYFSIELVEKNGSKSLGFRVKKKRVDPLDPIDIGNNTLNLENVEDLVNIIHKNSIFEARYIDKVLDKIESLPCIEEPNENTLIESKTFALLANVLKGFKETIADSKISFTKIFVGLEKDVINYTKKTKYKRIEVAHNKKK